MAPAAAPGFTIPAGGEDRVSVFARFGAISFAVLDAAPEPITQRVMELAVPAAERANAAAATDMGVSGSALKRERGIRTGYQARYLHEAPNTVSAWRLTFGADHPVLVFKVL